MRFFMLLALSCSLSFADILDLNSFKADFVQTVTDEKHQVLTYKGSVVALKPQYALWKYKEPVEKNVYIQKRRVTIVEPELEQVIVRKINQDFNIFTLIKNATKIDTNSYLAKLDETKIVLEFKDEKLTSLSYKDKFDNDVKVLFSNQQHNLALSDETFTPLYSSEYDLIQE